ncbi:MAG: transketolase C-terminal domain-containing protein [Candidatus Omnitrophica bacterium]|nr:transketolase C-terminal domain-containing protein [Candidatus Omnitrophota bacterium]
MRNAFINTILEGSVKRPEVFIISGDAGLGVFDQFKEKFPRRFLNLGVAEQNAASFSAGLALCGFKVYLYNIIPFLLYRCYEQVRNDICYQKLPIVLAGIGSGITYALQGMTHYSVEDIGLALTLPNLTVISPIDPIEAKLAGEFSFDCKNPLYVRLPKRGEPLIHKNANFDITKPRLVQSGEEVAIIFHGSISLEVLKAAEMLKKAKIYPKLISVPMLKPLDFKTLFSHLKNVKYVLSVEEHYLASGLGSILAREYIAQNPKWRLFSLGLPDKFIHEIKDLDGMREYFGISARKIALFVKNILRKKKG